MLLVYLLALAQAKFWDIVYGDFNGPLALGSSLSWQVSQIKLDSNHKDTFSTMYVFFNLKFPVQVDMKDFYAEIEVPGDEAATVCELYPVVEEINDWAAVCSYSVDEAGTYGPISLRIKFGETGQVFAEARAFGYFAVLDDEPTAEEDSLSVSYSFPEGKTDLFILDQVVLNFSFVLGAGQRLNPGDLLCLTKDENFLVNEKEFKIWVMDDHQEFKGIDAEYDDDNQKLYIYGFFEGIEGHDQGNTVTIIIKGLMNPWYENSGNNYDWSIDVLRFGTSTTLYSFAGTGPEEEVISKNVTVDSWKADNDKIKDFFANGQLTYTKIVFHADDLVPDDGSIVITVSKAKFCSKIHTATNKQVTNDGPGSGDASECSISARDEDSNYIPCSVADSGDGSVVTCSPDVTIKEKSKIYFTALTLTTAATLSITSILTRDGDGRTMNSLKDTFSTSATTATLLTVNQLYITESFNDIDGKNLLGQMGTYGIVLAFNAPVDLVAGDSIKLYMPVSSANSRNNEYVAMSSDFFGIYKIGDSLTFSGTTSLDSSSAITNNKVEITTNSIKFTLEASVTSGQGVIFYIGAGSKSDPKDIYLPLRPSLMSYLSESIVVLLKSSTTYLYSKPFYIDSNDQDLTFEIKPFCSNVYASGLPMEVSFTSPFDYSLGDLRAYVSFSQNFTSLTDMVTGDQYPTVGSKAYLDSNGDFMLIISSLKKNEPVSFTIAYPAFEASVDVSATLTVKLIVDSAEETVFTSTDSFTPDSEFSYSAASASISLQGDLSHTFTIAAANYDSDAATAQSILRYAFVVPEGFSLSGTTLSTLGMSNQYYNYKSGYTSGTFTESVANSLTATITGPWFEAGTQYMYVAVASGVEFGSDACIYAEKVTLTVGSALSMTFKDFKPQNQKGYSWGSEYIELVLTLSVSKNVMPSSYITFEIGDSWVDSYVDWWVYIVLPDELLGGEYVSSGSWKSTETTKKFTGSIEIHALVRLPKISSDSSSTSYIGFKSVKVYYNGLASEELSFSWTQSTDDTNSKVITKFTAGSTTPSKSSAESWAYPDVNGSKKVFFGTSFEADYKIGKGSVIEISSQFLDDSAVQENTWCNYGHSLAEISDGVLKVTLLQDVDKGKTIEIVKDSAFDLSSTGFRKVLIKVEVDGEYLIDDTADTSDDGSQGFTVKDKPSNEIQDDSIKTTKYNAAFDSWYSISLSFTETLENSDFIEIQVNKDFNAIPGNTFTLEYLPGLLYIESYIVKENDNFEFILCRVDHWLVSCMLPDSVKSNQELGIVLHLSNPVSKSYCSVYLRNWDGEITVQPFYISESNAFEMTQSFSGTIDLLSAFPEPSGSEKGMRHSLIIDSRIDLELPDQGAFAIVFPYPYNLGLTDPEKTRCQMIYDDGSSQQGQIISDENICSIEGNVVNFEVDGNLEANFKLSSEFITRFFLSGIVSPKDGYEGKPFFYDFPYKETAKYSSPFMAAFVSFSKDDDDFTIEDVDSFTMNNLNAAFAHFESSKYQELQINNGEKLTIAAGCFTGMFEIKSTKDKLFAREMEIEGHPRGDAPLILDRHGVYRIRPEAPVAEFMVGAPSTSDPGFYYIDWKIREDPFGKEGFYAPPTPTIVEINSDIQFPLTSPLEILVPPGYRGFPYPIVIDGSGLIISPFEMLEVRFEHNYTTSDIKFYPQVLFMDEKHHFAGLSISCENCTTDEEYQFKAILSGPSSDSFKVEEPFSFVFKKPYEYPAIIKVDIVSQTSNNIEISLYSDSLAVVSWALSGENNFDEAKMTENYIIENVPGFGTTDSNLTSFEDRFDEYSEELFDMMNNSASYQEFARQAMNRGRSIYLIQQDYVLEGESKTIASFSELVPGSTYFFYIYVNNFCGNESTFKNITIETNPLPAHAEIQVEDVTDEDNFTQAMVSLFKIDSNRMGKRNPKKGGNGPGPEGRHLATTQSYMVYSSMTSSDSAYDEVSQYSDDELSTQLGVTVTGVSKIDTDSYSDGSWEILPDWVLEGEIVNMTFTPSVDGSLVCEIETNPDTENLTITTTQVYYGLDRTGAENNDTGYSDDVYALTESSFVFNLTGYYENVYVISCIVCNDYPLTPQCSNVSSWEYSTVQSSSFASLVAVGLGLLVF